MGKKIKSPQCKGRWCQNHLFSIKPYLIKKDPIQENLRLCPRYHKDTKILERTMPGINLDRKSYTPLFVLDDDQVLYTNYDERNKQIFEDNKECQQAQISQIMLPRINTERKYCKVCKLSYQEYLDHLATPNHEQSLRRHPFSTLIVEMAENFKITRSQERGLQKNSRVSLGFQQGAIMESEMESALQDKETALKEKQIILQRNIEEDKI